MLSSKNGQLADSFSDLKMNIWYLSAYDQPKGQSSRTYDFSRRLVGRGHRVTMFTNSYCHFTHMERLAPGERWRIEETDGIRIVWMKTFPYIGNGWQRGVNMLSNVWRSIQVARTFPEKPDVVIGPSVPLGTGWAALWIARMRGSAFVFEVRDIWPQALVDLGMMTQGSIVYKVFRHIEKYLYRQAQRISAVLPLTSRHVGNCGVDPRKVSWIPNGVNIEQFQNTSCNHDGLPPMTAMYVGGFSSTHDVFTILRAASILQENRITGYRFVIVGSGTHRSECEKEASDLRLNNVEFRDPVPKSEIPILQMEADVLIASVKNTPVYQFGINSNKLYDYLASARPIIFSGNAPNDPVAVSGGGFSIAPEDPFAMAGALRKLLDMSPQERAAMGKRGRQYVEEEFDMHKLTDRMERLLMQAMRERGT